MRKKSMLSLLLASIVNTFIFCSISYASECNTESPNFSGGNSNYFDLDSYKRLTASEEKQLSSFIEKASGEWVGTLEHIECVGPEENSEPVVKSAKVESQVSNNGHDVFYIPSNVEYLESKILVLQKIENLGYKSIFSLDIGGNNALRLAEKFRRVVSQTGSLLVENIYEIKLNSDSLEISLTSYHNGYFAWRDVLALKRQKN